MLTALLASLVECIEALTVILAVGAVFGWRDALTGAGAALVVLLVAVVALGPALALIPRWLFTSGSAFLLLAFRFRWLQKAVRRAAGVLQMRDEEAAYVRHGTRLRALLAKAGNLHRTGMAARLFRLRQSRASRSCSSCSPSARRIGVFSSPASLGALAALALVAALGVALHRPLARLPENAIKFAVGVLTCAFGLFWIGEGIGIEWPGDDWSIGALAVVILAGAAATTGLYQAEGGI